MNDLKSGVFCTEFWIALVGQLLAALTLLGVLTSADALSLNDALGKGILGAFAVISAGAVAWKYIHSRTTLKSQPGPAANVPPPPPPM